MLLVLGLVSSEVQLLSVVTTADTLRDRLEESQKLPAPTLLSNLRFLPATPAPSSEDQLEFLQTSLSSYGRDFPPTGTIRAAAWTASVKL